MYEKIFQQKIALLGIEPGLLAWEATAFPQHYQFFTSLIVKTFEYIDKNSGQKGPPLGCQALKIYVGSNRAKSIAGSKQSDFLTYGYILNMPTLTKFVTSLNLVGTGPQVKVDRDILLK